MKKIVVPLVLIAILIIPFAKVFAGAWILPQYFRLGPLTIHYYGITMASAVGAGWWLAVRRASQYGLDAEKIDSFLTWLIFGGFVGARAYHVASSWEYYWQYPLDALKVWHGGLSIYGALLGGLTIVFCHSGLRPVRHSFGDGGAGIQKSVNTWIPGQVRDDGVRGVLDWLTPSLVLGQIVGRFGNFFNYEAFGYPTSLPWKMFVPEGFRPMGYFASQYYHPLFLYEALGNAIILCILLRLSNAESPSSNGYRLKLGALFFMYLFLYNALRFTLEHLRVDSTFIFEVFRLNVLVSGLLCLVGLLGYFTANYVFSFKKN